MHVHDSLRNELYYKGASPNDFCTLSVIVTLRGGGGPGHDVKKKINFQT